MKSGVLVVCMVILQSREITRPGREVSSRWGKDAVAVSARTTVSVGRVSTRRDFQVLGLSGGVHPNTL